METAAFRFGDCAGGAIVTITPQSAVLLGTVIEAGDGGVTFLTVRPQADGGRWVLRAWAKATGSYLGQYMS